MAESSDAPVVPSALVANSAVSTSGPVPLSNLQQTRSSHQESSPVANNSNVVQPARRESHPCNKWQPRANGPRASRPFIEARRLVIAGNPNASVSSKFLGTSGLAFERYFLLLFFFVNCNRARTSTARLSVFVARAATARACLPFVRKTSLRRTDAPDETPCHCRSTYYTRWRPFFLPR